MATTLRLGRDECGKIAGADAPSKRALARLKKHLAGMGQNDTMTLTFAIPRSPGFHRLHFKALRHVFDSQDRFTDFLHFRSWVKIGAEFCDLLPSFGVIVAVPRSICYESLEESEFIDVHFKCIEFLMSEQASRFLWPHLSPAQNLEMTETVIAPFISGREIENAKKAPVVAVKKAKPKLRIVATDTAVAA